MVDPFLPDVVDASLKADVEENVLDELQDAA